jgi:arylsulfatase A-like enzyme
MSSLARSCRRLAAMLAATALLAAVSHAATPGHAPLRRVALISCDAVRSASLPTYGNTGPVATTGLDSLLSEGVLFMRCTTPMGWTLPAHASMFTGLSPGAVRVAADQAIPEHVPLLAEVLDGEGFVCAGFPAENHWLEPRFGFGRGMTQYRFQPIFAPARAWTRDWTFAADLATRPFFLFFHFMDAHTVPVDDDYLLPYWTMRGIDRHYHGIRDPYPEVALTADGHWDLAAYPTDLLRRAYHAAIYSLDLHRLRPLLHDLRARGLTDQTMLIVTADHGEEIAEHGGYLHASPYGEVRDVPLLIVWPGVLPAGKVVFTPVSLLDLTPTILDYAGVDAPGPMQGLSLRPLMQDPPGFFPERDFLVDGHRRGLGLQPSALVGLERDTWWSLVASTDTTGCTGSYAPARVDSVIALFDLDRDPRETRDVQAQHPDVVSALRVRLDEALADEARLAATLQTGAAPATISLTDDERRRLRALGY